MRIPHNPTAILLVMAALIPACGSDDGGSGPGGGDVLTTVEVTPSTSTLNSEAPGNTVQLVAVAKNQNGETMSGVTVSFDSEEDGVATVSIAGLVTAAGAGTTEITASATVGGVTESGSATVTVTAPPAPVLTSVAVTPGNAAIFTVAPGNTIQLSATGKDQNGATLGGVTFSYSSEDGDVATVSPGGLVTAVGAGTVEITVTGTRDGVTEAGVSTVMVQIAPATATVLAPLGAYTPLTVDVSAGGVVTWTFADITHDVDFSGAGSPADIPPFNHGSESRTFPTNGTYQYICTLHPGMEGTVRVH